MPRWPEKPIQPFTTVQIERDGKIVYSWENDYVPSVDAVKYHAATGRRILAGGSRGGGKTRTECEDIAATMIKWPGIPIICGRKDLKDLKTTVMREFLLRTPEALYDPKNGGQFHKTDNFVRFWNNSIVYFVELKDVDSLRSVNAGRAYFDEMHEVPDGQNVMREIGGALRWTTEKGECKRAQCLDDARELANFRKLSFEETYKKHPTHPIRQVKMMTNPHGGWLKNEFYTPYKEGRMPSGYQYIPFSVYNNPGVDPTYIRSLLDNNPQWIKNYVDGSWDSFDNLAYPNFNRSVHTWKGPVPWHLVNLVEGGIDWGSTGTESHRTAMYLTARLKTGKLITFWEHSVQGVQTPALFATIREMTSKYKVNRWWSDASQFIANGHLRSAGVPVGDAPRHKGAVEDGVNLGNLLMTVDATGEPGWYVTEDCPRLMAGLESYSVDPSTGLYIKRDDDEVDAFRYNLMAIGTKHGHTPASSVDMVVKKPDASRKDGPSSILLRRRAEREERMRIALEGEKRWATTRR